MSGNLYMKLNKDANIAVYFERHDSDFGRLDRKPIEQVDWNKVKGFLLVRDNKVLFFLWTGEY